LVEVKSVVKDPVAVSRNFAVGGPHARDILLSAPCSQMMLSIICTCLPRATLHMGLPRATFHIALHVCHVQLSTTWHACNADVLSTSQDGISPLVLTLLPSRARPLFSAWRSGACADLLVIGAHVQVASGALHHQLTPTLPTSLSHLRHTPCTALHPPTRPLACGD
jgi:hypothetical protein